MGNLVTQGKKVKYYIFRTHITIRGITYYVKDYGLRAFRIPIYE